MALTPKHIAQLEKRHHAILELQEVSSAYDSRMRPAIQVNKNRITPAAVAVLAVAVTTEVNKNRTTPAAVAVIDC